MRKYLIVALAAFTAAAIPAVSAAQEDQGATMEVKVTPKKAGKKGKRARNSKLKLEVENQETSRTMSELRITSPRTVKLNTRGLTRCDSETLESQGPASCPRKSRVGKGIARALLGVNGPTPTPLTFDVTAVVTGNRNLDFFLVAREQPINVLAPGRIAGRNLTIQVPEVAQQPVEGVYAGLVSLEATLRGKKGKRKLLASTGCKKRKHSYSALLTFIDNGVSDAGTVRTDAASACRR